MKVSLVIVADISLLAVASDCTDHLHPWQYIRCQIKKQTLKAIFGIKGYVAIFPASFRVIMILIEVCLNFFDSSVEHFMLLKVFADGFVFPS